MAGHPKYPRSEQAPPLLDSQREALDTLLTVARRHGFKVDQHVGDILFVNNLSIMHARDSFLDDVEGGLQRHLLRLWLTDKKTSWEIASSLDYRNMERFDKRNDAQSLWTLSEWTRLPRVQRVTEAAGTDSHD